MMSILESCRELQNLLQKSSSLWDGIISRSADLTEIELDKLGKEVQCVIEECNEVLKLLVSSMDIATSIQSSIGIYNFFASTGLATTIIAPLTLTAYDASAIYSPEPSLRLTDLIDNPIPGRYKNPNEKILGDLGEICVLKMLIDPEGEDKFTKEEIDQIQVKPSLPSTQTAKEQKPDFYVPSRSIVVDAKAWKKVKTYDLRTVVDKYVNLECMAQGGEVRLYFPSDVYQRDKTLLEKLPTQVGNVRVRFIPMDSTYNDLTWQHEFIRLFFKCLARDTKK